MRRVVEFAAAGIGGFAVAVIVISFFFATVRFLLRSWQKQDAAYNDYKLLLGRSMLLGLTFLVAADVISTVALAPSLSNIEILGMLVILRTFLSWSLVVELEGHWPWQSGTEGKPADRAGRDNPRKRAAESAEEVSSPARWDIGVPGALEGSTRNDPPRSRKAGILSNFPASAFAHDPPILRRNPK